MANNQKKNGSADIVFLLDATYSMSSCIERLKNNICQFIDMLTTPDANQTLPVKDWRAKVVGFRDAELTGANEWWTDNPFVRDADVLKKQLAHLEVRNGVDNPETLLDALYLLATMDQSAKEDPESGFKWRSRSSAVRVIVAFTDADFKPRMFIPQAKGGGIDKVRDAMYEHRIYLSLFAPDLPCFEEMSQFDRSEFIPSSGSGLDELTSDPKAFQETLKMLAASISSSCAAE